MKKISVFRMALSGLFFASLLSAQEAGKNWLCGGVGRIGTFEDTEFVAEPWGGVDEDGYLRKSVSMPTANPFVTKSNQFSYTWLGSSASFVDMDGDGLPDIVSPDGNGIVWCWKNRGSIGSPAFENGEVIPVLVDDLRSEFRAIFRPEASGKNEPPKVELSAAEQASRKRIEDKRDRALERLLKKNDRLPKDKQVSRKDLEKEVEALFPYETDKKTAAAPEPTPANRVTATGQIPQGGLTCTLNTFRRLRLIAAPGDWNGDKLTDFIFGDSGGTVYFAPNIGKPGQPNFGYLTRLSNALPLKVVRMPAVAGRTPTYQPVEFLNYAMPFVCDWDGNGVSDLLLGEGTYSVNAVRLFANAARSTLQNPPRETALLVGEERTFLAPFAYDWDGDGDLDLFVCDASGRLTVHRRTGTPAVPSNAGPPPTVVAASVEPKIVLEDAQDLKLDGGNAVLAYCTPQPCDWNADGTMDLIWGEPYGRIMVSIGKSMGGLEFSAPEAVRSTKPVTYVSFPRDKISAAAVPARSRLGRDAESPGGTASSERFYDTDGTSRENEGGWPNNSNKAMYGLVPSWSATRPRTLAQDLDRDSAGNTGHKQPSWAIAPLPGDCWEVVDESGAPGEGRTFLLRWHDTAKNAIFKVRTPRPPQWTPGVAVAFRSGRSGPFADHYTKGPITIRFQMKLDGVFSRLDVNFDTNWGPLGGNGKPPVEGGDFSRSMMPLPRGQWFEFSYTQEPDEKLQRGLDGSLFVQLLGEGEVRIRDVRVLDGK